MSRKRILIIEDDDLLRRVLRAELEDLGHDVVEAIDGREGVLRCQTCGCDLLITDIVMPEKDGLEVIREVSRTNPAIKIIATTGYNGSEEMGYLALAAAYGAERVLRKPFDATELTEAVSSLLSG